MCLIQLGCLYLSDLFRILQIRFSLPSFDVHFPDMRSPTINTNKSLEDEGSEGVPKVLIMVTL